MPDHASIHLADEPPFRLGDLDVHPATRQLTRAGLTQALEPRVMEVLVALARAQGEVVSRDALIDACWGGRIVGENAIHRVTSRIRQLTATIGAGSFALETIPKIGYRLVTLDPPPGDPGPVAPETPPYQLPGVPMDRRLAIGGLATVAAGVAGFLAWRATVPREVNDGARVLIAKGREALRQGVEAEDDQAVAYFRRATEADPGSAEVWGALALGYQRRLHGSDGEEQNALAVWVRSTARHSLALDPGNADGEAAMLLIPSAFRNWRAMENRWRDALRRRPEWPSIEGALAYLLDQVGRPRAAIPLYERLLGREPFEFDVRLDYVWTLWHAGELTRAETALDDAARLWPGHLRIWWARVMFLTLTGRPGAAIAFASDLDARPPSPPGNPPLDFDMYVTVARALMTRDRADTYRAVATILEARAQGRATTPHSVNLLSALGAVGPAFDQLGRYYFGSTVPGAEARPPGPLSRRITSVLFHPATAPLRADPRFSALTRKLGLEDYWRAMGTAPDYRR